jgi:hypothetical protein
MTIVFVFAKCLMSFVCLLDWMMVYGLFLSQLLLDRGRGEQNRVMLCWLLTPKGLTLTLTLTKQSNKQTIKQTKGIVLGSSSVGDTRIQFVCFILGIKFDGVNGVVAGIVISNVSNQGLAEATAE